MFLIRNAVLVNEGERREGDLLIDDAGRIARIDAAIPAPPRARVLDAAGRWLLPGMIDDQVHFREPGLTHKGDIASESRAAVAGGITSYMEMPNCQPPTVDRAALAEKRARAAGRSWANFAFYLGATHDNLEEIKRLEGQDACGVKVFMGASTGNMLVDDPAVLEAIFRDCPLPIATHCEDTPMIRANEAAWRARYGDAVPVEAHPAIRSAEACYASSSLAVSLAKRHGARLHVLHLTTAREMELFEPGPVENKRITAEVCVHHLFFDERDYPRLGNRIKCNPAIKTPADREALLAAVLEDRIDVIATDHAPHTREEKERPYLEAPAGLPLVQHALLSLLEHHHDGRLPLETIVQKTAHAPALRFEVAERGFLREGYFADLVLVDPEGRTEVTADSLLYRCGWSPFEGYTFRSRIAATWVNGTRVYEDGRIVGEPAGRPLDFAR